MTGPDDLARAAAEWMVSALQEESGQPSGQLAVALSGGSTPKRLYELLAAPEFKARVPWDRVHWFWGDERFVPRYDGRSNFHMAWEAMLRQVPVNAWLYDPIPTEGITPEESAAAYQTTLRNFHASDRLDERPLFHIVLLGLGTNGHTASLFPNTAVLEERTAWVAPVSPEGEETRITLTYPALESCRHAAFLVAGADKRDVLARVRAGDASLPAGRYRPQGELRWFTDAAAEHG